MDFRSMVPFGSGGTQMACRGAADDPFTGFRREMDRLFDDFFSGRAMTSWPGNGSLHVGLNDGRPPRDSSSRSRPSRISRARAVTAAGDQRRGVTRQQEEDAEEKRQRHEDGRDDQ